MNNHFPQVDFLSRRALAFSGIAAFHILIAYLLLTALVQPPPRKQETPMDAFLTPMAVPKPPPDSTDFRPSDHNTRIPVPAHEPWAPPQGPSPVVTSAGDPPAAGGTGAIPAALPIRMIGANQLPNTEDFYPPDLRRLNVTGATNVRVCVDAQGMRQGDPSIEESSGNARLDMGAVNIARHGRYARAMQGDTPVGSCYRFRIAFKITK
jgi:outer membrane biosynthesis protein TonB